MKLPEWSELAEEALVKHGPAASRLARLHCLRSIAVSLECIAKTLSCQFSPSTRDHECWIERLDGHSVREVPGD